MEIDIDEDSGSYLRDRKQLCNNGQSTSITTYVQVSQFLYNTLIVYFRSKIE